MEAMSSTKNFTQKIVLDYDKLARAVLGLQAIERRVVLTIGSWDLLHIGHVRYLTKAKESGDFLIVGVDSDRAIKVYKKTDLRPIVPEAERCEMLSYQSCVDLVTLLDDVNELGIWQYLLLNKIRPDVFVATEDSYPEDQLTELQKRCGEVLVLPRQAENTSTTKLIQHAVKKHLDQFYELIEKR